MNYPILENSDQPLVDVDTPNVARIYDYLLGGGHNLRVDREHAERTKRLMPSAEECARTNREFATTAVQVAIREYGIGQFLDLGAGIPTAGGLHATAQRLDPNVHWVAADNEPVAVEVGMDVTQDHRHVQYVLADFLRPWTVLKSGAVRDTLDFGKPLGIILCAALHLVPDGRGPVALVARYRGLTVPGSVLILSHGTLDDPDVPAMREMPEHYRQASNQYTPRSYDEVVRFTKGYTLAEPGVAFTGRWRPELLRSAARPSKSGAYAFLGVRDTGE